jgi:hypothetical protein
MTLRVRRSGRIAKEEPILLTGSDVDGKVFCEKTKTVVLSRHGAGILSRYKLSAEDEVIIRSGESNKEAIAHVVGQIGLEAGVYTYGVAFVDPNVHFWNTLFPPPTPSEKSSFRLTLQCNACGAGTTIENAEEAADVYAINDGIVRFCQVCGYSTVWKIASDPVPLPTPKLLSSPAPDLPRFVASVPSRPPLPALPSQQTTSAPSAYSSSAVALDDNSTPDHSVPPTDPIPLPAAIPGSSANRVNRRKYVRARVTFAACIRTPEFGDDITTCEDISRGGLRFKSRKRYPIGTNIEVAVPYSAESQGIFVPGRVVFVQDLPDQGMSRHGICYLPASKV